jgi:FlaA1/EpsC-like NDP-sugar epimerase
MSEGGEVAGTVSPWNRRTLYIGIFEAFLVLVSYIVAWVLKFEFTLTGRTLLIQTAPLLVAIRMFFLARQGLLHGWWRYTGVSDALDITKAVALGSVVFSGTVYFILNLRTFPRSMFVLEAVFTGVSLAGVRLLSRLMAEWMRKGPAASHNVVILGAGFGGQMIVRELKRPGSRYTCVACIDDNPSMRGARIHGVPIVGGIDDLAKVVQTYGVDEAWIAVPSATGPQMKRFVAACEKVGVRFRTIPSMSDLINGRSAIHQLRDVNLDDLLGRQPVEVQYGSVSQEIADKVVMVTGAAGSIGSELCRQILRCSPKALICLDQNENGMFHLQMALDACAGERTRMTYCVSDVYKRDRLRALLQRNCVETIFHAAAYKHVPMMEKNVHEAVDNNVFGLLGLMDLAEAEGCRTLVMISSDKAVNPTNVMGATKRLGEIMLASRPFRGMRSVAVRFGNVLGSNGSLIPLLQEQIRNGGELTITHPDVERFFMTVQEASSLVLQAAAIGNNGDILLLDMGSPIKIVEIAKTLLVLMGKSPQEVPFRYIGLRPGEKLREELIYASEEILPTSHPKIKRIRSSYLSWNELLQHLQELRSATYVDGPSPIRSKIKEIIPEYIFNDPVVLQRAAKHSVSSSLNPTVGD